MQRAGRILSHRAALQWRLYIVYIKRLKGSAGALGVRRVFMACRPPPWLNRPLNLIQGLAMLKSISYTICYRH